MWGGVFQFNCTKDVVGAQSKVFSTFMDPKNLDDAAEMGIILNFGKPRCQVSRKYTILLITHRGRNPWYIRDIEQYNGAKSQPYRDFTEQGLIGVDSKFYFTTDWSLCVESWTRGLAGWWPWWPLSIHGAPLLLGLERDL